MVSLHILTNCITSFLFYIIGKWEMFGLRNIPARYYFTNSVIMVKITASLIIYK